MVPEVTKCNVSQCVYNTNDMCCAHAITVGSSEPYCETFKESSTRVNRCGQSEVGACHIDQCMFNSSMFCHACDDIEVKWSGGEALCATFRSK